MNSSSSKDFPLISVVVPVYNVEKYIMKCVETILSQTYTNLDIIVIDDGSTDNSGKICDELSTMDERIRVIHKKNGGLSDARNSGIELAKGEYITFIDSDDYILRDYIRYLYDLLMINNAEISVCQLINVDENNNEISKPVKIEDFVVYGNEACMKEYLTGIAIDTVAWRKLYKLELFKSGIRYPVGKYHEDVWTTYRLIALCNKIAVGKRPLYAYRLRNGSIVNSSFSPKHLDSVYGAITRQKFIEQQYPNLSSISCVSIIYAANICLVKMVKSKTKNIKPYVNLLQPLYRKYLRSYLKSNVRNASKVFALFASIHIPVFTFILRKLW